MSVACFVAYHPIIDNQLVYIDMRIPKIKKLSLYDQ